jgi:protein-tyrosine-phosphatase
VWSKVIASLLLALGGLLIAVFHRYWMGLVGLLRQGSARTPKTLIFLSSGGTCRDPMAKAITDKLLETRQLKRPVNVRAFAVAPPSASTASYAARYVIKEMYGEDLLADHKPAQLTAEHVQKANLILAMSKSLINAKTMPLAKTHSFKEFFGMNGDVADPYPDGKDATTIDRYRKCATELRQILTQHLDRLVQVLDL